MREEEQRTAPLKNLEKKKKGETKAKKANERSIKVTKDNKAWRRKRKKEAKGKTRGALHSTPKVPQPSREANEHDNKDLFIQPILSKEQSAKLDRLMTRPSPRARANHTNNFTVVRKGNQSVMQHSMAALHEGEWVVDDVLEFYLRHLVSPTREGIQCYGTHFMDALLGVDDGGTPGRVQLQQTSADTTKGLEKTFGGFRNYSSQLIRIVITGFSHVWCSRARASRYGTP